MVVTDLISGGDVRGLRLVVAAPGATRHELARIKLAHYRVAAADSGVAVVRRAPGRLAQLVVVGYDGSKRAVTPALNDIGAPDLDGDRLAFTAGRCVFAGPLPAQRAAAAPRDACFGEPAVLSFRRLDRIDQRGGSRLWVPLTCTVPPRNRCSVHLRLHGPGFTVHKRTRIRPGRRIVNVPIPAAHRRAAWRNGMQLVTIEQGQHSAGAAVPRSG